MSNPIPPPPPQNPWHPVLSTAGSALLGLIVGAAIVGWFAIPDKPAVDPAPVVVVDPVTPPAPAPPAPAVAMERWAIYVGKTRITDKTVEEVAAKLKPGTYRAEGTPPPGGDAVTLSIVVSDGTPPVPEPPKPEPPVTPPVEPPVTPPTVKATAATYVYEKDSGGVPSAVMAGLNKVNRDSKFTIIAAVHEDDGTDGTGEVPEQFKAALAAARTAGLPALVVTAGSVVLKVVKDPKTSEAIAEAVQ